MIHEPCNSKTAMQINSSDCLPVLDFVQLAYSLPLNVVNLTVFFLIEKEENAFYC